jgi:hypothetical protein
VAVLASAIVANFYASYAKMGGALAQTVAKKMGQTAAEHTTRDASKVYNRVKDTFGSQPKLDFSHLGVKGIDAFSTLLHNKRSLLLPTRADHCDRALGSLHATRLKTRLPTRFLFCRGLSAGRSGRPTRKKSEGPL